MSLKPTVTLHGALPVLQPEYFSSDIFVVPLRLDIEKLLTEFTRRLRNHSDHCGLAEPVTNNATDQNGIFKDNSLKTFISFWTSSDWKFMHLRCLDAIGRTAFVRIVHRIFLEASITCADEFMRLGALYGLYTFHMTQPSQLHRVLEIPVPLDHLLQFSQLPLTFQYPHKLVATHLISTLISQHTFRLLPVSSLRPMNPTILPQTFIAISTTAQDTTPRGPGRVTVTNRLRTAKRAVDELQAFLDGDSSHVAPTTSGSPPSFTDYTSLRALMTDTAGPETIDNAIRETGQNLRNAEDILAREGMAVEVDPEIRNGQLLGLVRDGT
ncbi:hypothetical protein OPQ81_007675 [Rhizoctonia solani]|nr:hypothetical protein OPQ81_007675 [Rhizoctonia solani]